MSIGMNLLPFIPSSPLLLPHHWKRSLGGSVSFVRSLVHYGRMSSHRMPQILDIPSPLLYVARNGRKESLVKCTKRKNGNWAITCFLMAVLRDSSSEEDSDSDGAASPFLPDPVVEEKVETEANPSFPRFLFFFSGSLLPRLFLTQE